MLSITGSIRLIIIIVALTWMPIGLTGCAGGESNSSVTDPTHVSAHDLFDHIQSICNQEYPDAEAYYALVHTETPKQEAWLAHIQNIELPKNRFAKACHAAFGNSR